MSCSLIDVWKYSWADIWAPLIKSSNDAADLIGDLVSGTASEPNEPVPPATVPADFDAVGNLTNPTRIEERAIYEAALERYQSDLRTFQDAQTTETGRAYFKNTVSSVATERQVIELVKNAHSAIEDEFSARLEKLFIKFCESRNVGYSMGPNFEIRPTMLGMFGRLRAQANGIIGNDSHLADLWADFEEAYAALEQGKTNGRIRNCLSTQFIFIEALAQQHPEVNQSTFGQMCHQLDWPHPAVRQAASGLYGFRSDCPGLGHGGNPDAMLRQLNMKDVIGISMLLFSLTPYLTNDIDLDACYAGTS